ncbi:MAG: thiamine diphosphokinase [Ignavibacteriaceae bacterium]
MNKCIIIANGKSPTKKTVQFFYNKGYTTIICADGGANSANEIGVTPDYIIGDLDSIKASTKKYFLKKSTIIKYKRQNDTDVEKCLKFAIKKKFDEVALLGVAGDRLDHTICNLGIVIKFYNKIKILLVAQNSFLIPTDKLLILNSKMGETISIYGFNEKTKITSKGLKYPLKNSSLPFGIRESTSNISTSSKVKLDVSGGIIFVIRDFNILKKYDLI